MSEFSPFSAETSGMELAVTNSRIKGWRRNRRSAQSLLPAVRAVAPFHYRRRRRGFSAGGGVENRKNPAVTGKAAGSRQKFKEESQDDK